jgi:excisionase family DNA binding protein
MSVEDWIKFDGDRTRLLNVVGLVDQWPKAFLRYLEGLATAAPVGAKLKQMFSPAHTVVNQRLRDQEFLFVRRAFYEAVGNHYRGDLCKRHSSLMPELVKGHRFQALAKVARQTGVSRVGLKRMVECAAVPGYRFSATSGAGREVITLDPAEVKELVASRPAYKCLKSAAAFLGLKRSRLRQLVALGVLTAESHPEWDRTSHWFLADKELQSFIERLRRRSQLDQMEHGIAFKAILRFWRLAPQELKALVDALLAGSVSLQLPENVNLSAMLVDGQRARAWLKAHRTEAVSWLTPTQAAKALGLKEQVVYELIDRSLLRAQRTRGGRGWLNRIDRHELQAFRETYISLATLAHTTGKAPRALLKALAVAPVTGPAVDGARQYFFRRTDLHRDGLEGSGRVLCLSSEVVL